MDSDGLNSPTSITVKIQLDLSVPATRDSHDIRGCQVKHESVIFRWEWTFREHPFK
ncbi:hypothetical protein CRG98_013766, partial [Punica granatum]